MSQSLLLKIRGLYSLPNRISEVPSGALIQADNVNIDRDSVAQSRRGNAIYGNAMGISSTTLAKQLLRYKGRVLRHFLDDLQFDDGSGTFTSFSGDYNEVDAGLRIKGLEANGNFYFTTSDGIKKISALTASNLSSSAGFITDAGGVKAIDIEGVVNYENPGFFTEESKVAYRVVWGIRDANNNLILGSPSSRLVITNVNTLESGTVDLTINIPEEITENYFYQVYRSAVKEAGASPLDEIDPGDELYLVIEDFPTATDISNGFVEVSDVTPEDFRVGGTLLYTNPISGDGILQANEPPPLAKDVALFKGSTYYANTKTRHRNTIALLSVSDFVSGTTKFTISNGTTTNIYTFVGAAEVTTFTFDSFTNTTANSYFIIYSAEDARKYVVWFNKGGGTQPAAGDTTGAIFIQVSIDAGDTTGALVRAKVKIAMDAADSGDFTYIESLATLQTTNALNGNTTNAAAGATPPGGAFAIVINTQGDGENAAAKEVLLSNNASVAQAVDETARSLVRIINKQAAESVYAYYLSGPDDVPGQILLENRDLTDTPFYVAISHAALSSKWNPSLPAYFTITANTAASPTSVTTSASHGFASGDEVVIGNSNSTPTINGVRIVTVTGAATFTVPVNVTIAGTTGVVFLTTVASDNEESPNRVYFSKDTQPEAVPIVNYLDIGPKDSAIKRILALRDSLFVLKEDGVYRLTGEQGQIPTVSLFDSSTPILAPDSAAALNNQIYMQSDQGIAAISDTGVSIISRQIEDLLLKLASAAYVDYQTATWAVAYESDRSYLFFTVTETDDEVATQCFRYNTFTAAWTRWDVTKTCGIIGSDDKLYLGAGDTNFIEQERKNFNRTDYADRVLTSSLPAMALGTDGVTMTLGAVSTFDEGDAVVQTQYLTISQFHQLLHKLDIDPTLSDSNYFTTLEMEAGDNLSTKITALVAKLNADDSTRMSKTFASGDVNTGTDTLTITSHGFVNGEIVHFTSSGSLPGGLTAGTAYYIIGATTHTFQVSLTSGGSAVNLTSGGSGTHTVTNNYFFSGTTTFSTIQTEYNLIINQLNMSVGVFYSDYELSSGTVDYEAVISDINLLLNQITVNDVRPWFEGALSIFKGISTVVQWVPQSMQDVSLLKHVSEATTIFENKSFFGGDVSYRSDLSRSFETISFIGAGYGGWGSFPWGENLWGGEGAPTPFRTLIPQQKQRCRYLDCQFSHINAREIFSLYGMSLTYEASSTRAYR